MSWPSPTPEPKIRTVVPPVIGPGWVKWTWKIYENNPFIRCKLNKKFFWEKAKPKSRDFHLLLTGMRNWGAQATGGEVVVCLLAGVKTKEVLRVFRKGIIMNRIVWNSSYYEKNRKLKITVGVGGEMSEMIRIKKAHYPRCTFKTAHPQAALDTWISAIWLNSLNRELWPKVCHEV